MNEPRKSARVTSGGLNAGDLPVESRAEGAGKSLVQSMGDARRYDRRQPAFRAQGY